MATEHADFLRRITENPEDDTARLVYSDWLEENGQLERAEFIRLQIEIANRPESDPEQRLLNRRANLLWAGRPLDNPFWQAPFPLPRGAEFGDPVRGFVDRITCQTIEVLKSISRELIETSPVRTLRLVEVANAKVLADSVQLFSIRRLCLIQCSISADQLAQLLESPFLENLTALDLDHNALQPAAVERLIRSPVERKLRELWLGCNRLGDTGVAALASPGYLTELESLDLSQNGIGMTGIEALARVRHWRRLKHLNLTGNGLSKRLKSVKALTATYPNALRV